MTQKISPSVFASAVRMASTMRRLSMSEIIGSPAPRGAATAKRAATTGEPTGEAGPGGASRARDRYEDRPARVSARSWAGLRVSAALPGNAAYDHEEDE